MVPFSHYLSKCCADFEGACLSPTSKPSGLPTKHPSYLPTPRPTLNPSPNPTPAPTYLPTGEPTFPPTYEPTARPTHLPTDSPTYIPTNTVNPTHIPTRVPTPLPSEYPTLPPTKRPTHLPTAVPTSLPSTTHQPTISSAPTITLTPSETPTVSQKPTGQPTPPPTAGPTYLPSEAPTHIPTVQLECSKKRCSELNWVIDKFGTSAVCGASDEAPLTGCSGKVTSEVAQTICQSVGARLCSVEELSNDEARATGCNYDTALVWGRERCITNKTQLWQLTNFEDDSIFHDGDQGQFATFGSSILGTSRSVFLVINNFAGSTHSMLLYL